MFGFGQTLDALLLRSDKTGHLGTVAPSPKDASSPTPGPRFNARATTYMEGNKLQLDDDDLSDLSSAIRTLYDRGAREGLVLLDAHAFLINVSRREVVSAMSRRDAAGAIFPQVDATISIR